MTTVILLVPLAAIAVVWFLIVRFRSKLTKLVANVIGAIAGLIVGILVLVVLLPEPSEADKSRFETERVAKQATEAAKKIEQQRLEAYEADAARRQVPQAALDRITLIYLNHKIYADKVVHCTSRVFGQRSMVGCMASTLDGLSAPSVWLYEDGKFLSVNGTARGLAESRFSNESDIAVSKLPLPADIDVHAVVESFKRG